MNHRELYKKSKGTLLLKNAKDRRIVEQENRRKNKRQQMYESTRVIEDASEDVVIPELVPKKLSIQQRFKEYKKEKELIKEKKRLIRPPFISAVPSGRFISSPKTLRTRSKLPPPLPPLVVVPTNQKNLKKIKRKSPDKNLKLVKKNVKTSFDAPKLNPFLDKQNTFNSVTSTSRKEKKSKDLDTLFDDLSPIDTIPPEPYEIVLPIHQQTIIMKTPIKSEDGPNKYLSPFVSTVRGKGSRKRETLNRETVYKLQSPEIKCLTENEKQCKVASDYFMNVLNTQIDRLNQMADEWEVYKNEQGDILDDDAVDMIDVAIGQTRLLIANKLEQFRSLIVQCTGQEVKNPVLPVDLEGFWALVYIQVENIDERYKKLVDWKENSWVDPVIQKEKKLKTEKKNKKKKKIAKTTQLNFDKIVKMASKAQKDQKQYENDVQSTPTPSSVKLRRSLRTPKKRISLCDLTNEPHLHSGRKNN